MMRVSEVPNRVLPAPKIEVQPVISFLAVRVNAEAIAVDADATICIERAADLADGHVFACGDRLKSSPVAIPSAYLD